MQQTAAKGLVLNKTLLVVGHGRRKRESEIEIESESKLEFAMYLCFTSLVINTNILKSNGSFSRLSYEVSGE